MRNIAKAIATHDRTLSGTLLPQGIVSDEETNRMGIRAARHRA
jgi:hypothetical protein